VADHPDRHDPKHLVTHRFESDPSLFCKELLPHVLENQEDGWLQNWQQTSENISVELETFFKGKKDLTEPGIVHFLKETLTDDCALFLSNSMPVRDMDQFFFAKQATGPVFCNRGVSGIDGNIATAIGIAQGCKKPVLALLGDLAALHDLNALAQLKKASYPVILLILNNQGGAIFSFFPISEKKEIFEEFFAACHPYSFEKAAVLFDVPYFTAQNKEKWEALLPQRLLSPISCVIELKTNRKENLLVHQEIARALQEKVGPKLSYLQQAIYT
jgi:2-succinyl-5-enolpyruvyl-6-hydroxy-3-cyclohexene-1-carboxylate synthase